MCRFQIEQKQKFSNRKGTETLSNGFNRFENNF